MAAITIIDDEIRSLFFHTESGVVHHKIKGRIRGSEFRDLLSRGAELMEKKKAIKWLSDDRDSGLIAPEDSQWAEQIWAPRVIKAGFKYWAVVIPMHAVGTLQMRRIANEYRKRGVTVDVYGDLTNAMNWLASVT